MWKLSPSNGIGGVVMQRVLGVPMWLWLHGATFALSAVAAAGTSQWALETFVSVAATDGDVLQVELRRHCCHGIAQTTASFCKEFEIPAHDCGRLGQFVQQSRWEIESCKCADAETGLPVAQKLSTASIRVVDSAANRSQWIKLAVHEGDLAVLDDRVDELCARLELSVVVCGNVRAVLRERSLRDEMEHYKNALMEVSTDPLQVERVVAAMRRMMDGLLSAHKRVREELTQKALANDRIVQQSKRERHALERQVRELERQLQARDSAEARSHHTASRARSVVEITVRHPPATTTRPRFAPGTVRIPRVHATNFSHAHYLELAQASTPVIIQGLADLPGSPGLPPWTLQSLLHKCGAAIVTLKRPVEESTDHGRERSSMMWAGIEPVAKAPLRHFLRDFTASGASTVWPHGYADLYLHDASIGSFCPKLLEEFMFPRYFTDDRLQLLPNSKQASYWPSLFIGGASTASALHADWASTAAWMGLIAGRKHWAIAKPSARAALHELIPTEQAPSEGRFNASLLAGELSALLRPGEVYEDILEAGEVLFIPADCPHQVQNLEQTIAVAANFVDDANTDAFAQRIRTSRDSTTGDQSRIHALALRRLAELEDSQRKLDRSAEPIDLSYAQFKARNRRPT